ncbi:MAG: CelD/BcsL family acetyltransferase involved in cellulose biosynthesis [Pirellulaceae bacterium]|jgi:CelD/BcsL family acetyltransferase involved in cellulose biosynthesis
MKIQLQTPEQLTSTQLLLWKEIQTQSRGLASGLFCPELVQAVAEFRGGIEVAVIEEDGATVGFFPFHRDQAGHGSPFAGPLADFQGAIIGSDLVFDPIELLVACELQSWSFDHLLAEQAAFAAYHVINDESAFMDLSNGFDAYRAERKKAKSDELSEALRKGRKIQRDVAALRFVARETNPVVLDQVLDWKAKQLQHKGLPNALQTEWIRPLLHSLHNKSSPDFAGMLSAVYVGDDLLAATIGVRSRQILHGWVTCFDPQFYKYSPGLILLTELAKAAEALGIQRIDMGKGPESFKRSFRSGAIELAEGIVSRNGVTGAIQQNWMRAKEWAKSTALGESARKLVHSIKAARGQ